MGGSVVRLSGAVVAGVLFAQPLFAQTADVRFGNLHAHTSYSDGLGEPFEAYEQACGAGLDFFAITEHNHGAGDGTGERKDGKLIGVQRQLYSGTPESLVEVADALDRPGVCVTLYGQEFSTISKGNHVNVFDVEEVIDVPDGEFAELLEWVDMHRDGGGERAVLQFNHPSSGRKALKDYGRDDFGDGSEAAWLQAMPEHVSLIEVFNAPALRDGQGQRTHDRSSLYRRYLNLGFHLAPSVGQDNHYRNWGTSTDARVAVITPDFTRRGIIAALRARHAYASEDRNLRVVFRSGSALQGDIVPPPPGEHPELPLTVQIVDDDEPDAIYRVDVFKDIAGGPVSHSPVESFEFVGNQVEPVPLEGIRLEREGEYVFLRIVQQADEDGEQGEHDDEHPLEDTVWTAPIWYESDHFHDERGPSRSVVIASLLPDPPGDDFTGERITFRNLASVPVSMEGWQVRDLAGNVWELGGLGQLAPGQEMALLRGGQPMALNNGGDQIELVAPDGTVVQLVTYGKVAEGEVVVPAEQP
jgi:hypothetical protein